MTQGLIRSYSELSKLKTFRERYEYLRLRGDVGVQTFGRDRYLNQIFYHRTDWKNFRRQIILRDNGCDLGVPGYEFGPKQMVIIHHMNPIRVEEILNNPEMLMDPEYVISVSLDTHNAIHYGKELVAPTEFIERQPNDTIPWRR